MKVDPLDLLHADLIELGQRVEKNRLASQDIKENLIEFKAVTSLKFKIVFGILALISTVFGSTIGYALQTIFNILVRIQLGGV